MPAVKYSRLSTEDQGDQYMVDLSATRNSVDMSRGDTFNYSSAFEFGKASKAENYGSAFTYNKVRSKKDIAIEDVEHTPSLAGIIVSPIVTLISYLLVFLTLPISAWFTFRMIKHYERLVVFRLGKLQKMKGPGLTMILPCIDRIKTVDVRTKAFSVPPQKVMTADGGTIEIGADVYYQVCDPVRSVAHVQDYDQSTRSLCQLILQKSMAKYSLAQSQSDQAAIGRSLQEDVSSSTAQWGIVVSKVQLSPVKVIQEPNILLEGTNLVNAPLDCLGPMLFPPGTTHMPIQPLQQRGLLPASAAGPNTEAINALLSQMMSGLAAQASGRVSATKTNTGGSPVAASVSEDGAVGGATAAAAPVHPVVSPKILIEAVRPHLTAELVDKVKAMFRFSVTGEEAGDFFLDLKHGAGSIGEGLPPGGAPDVILTLSQSTLEQLLVGEQSAFQAYVGGRLKVDGDLHAAMALQAVVEAVQIGLASSS